MNKTELDLSNFKNMSHIKTSSMWLGNFSDLKLSEYGDNKFHTRFHPEITYQMMLRYTKKVILFGIVLLVRGLQLMLERN